MKSKGNFVRLLLPLIAIFVGCANPYEKFYHDQLFGRHINEVPSLEITSVSPSLYATENMPRDLQAMVENGFALIGYSTFNSGPVDSNKAMEHAKNLGAAVVIVQSRYTHTVTGSVPWTVQNPDQTVTTMTQGNLYGSGGYSTFSGTSTSTAPGGSTTYQMPYSVDRSDYVATYWVKRKPPALGIIVADLPDTLRQKLQRNRGVVVLAVLKGSPAFAADILKGDVVVGIDGDATNDPRSFLEVAIKYRGKRVTIKIIRDGKPMNIDLTLNKETGE